MLTRRTLLGTAGASLYAQTIALPRKVRVGMIGLAQGTHFGEITAPLNRLPDVEIVAVAESQPAAVERFKRHPRASSAKLYTDPRQMLDSEKLDVVAVNTT